MGDRPSKVDRIPNPRPGNGKHFAKEFYEESKIPFVVPKLYGGRRIVPLQSHEKADKYWIDSVAHKSRGPSQQLCPQAWILYIQRFSLTGDLCNSWESFGGIAALLSHLSISLNLWGN